MSASSASEPHPNHDMVTRLEKPRGFEERVDELGAFPDGAVAHLHLRHFCFPTELCGPFPSDGEPAYFHTFCLTNEDGTREHGACLTTLVAERYGLHGLMHGKTAARPLSIVVFSKWPLLGVCARRERARHASRPCAVWRLTRLPRAPPARARARPARRATCAPAARRHEDFLRQLWAERREHRWHTAAGGALSESIVRYVRELDACTPAIERLFAHGLHLPHLRQLPAVLRALRWRPEALVSVLLGALTNRKVLVVSSDASLPAALIGCVTCLLFPLEYPGVVVPLLPASLHPDPATLINENVAPFLIGVDAELAAAIAPFSDDLTVVDLDSGEVRSPSPDPFEAWLRAPVCERLIGALRTYAFSDDELSPAAIRIGCLRFVLDVVDLDDGALPNSAHPADRVCAAQWRLAGRLIDDLLGAAREVERSGAELDEEALQRQAQLCRAAYVRELLLSEPLGARPGRDSNLPLLRDVFSSTACSEYMSKPLHARARLAEPHWLHWRRLGAQFDCSVREHTAGVLLGESDIARALRARGVALARRRAPAHGSDWPTAAPFAPPSVEVVTAFCDAFDSVAVGELVACAPCVLVDEDGGVATSALGGTPAALAGAAGVRGSLVSGQLYLTDSHACFQSAGELAPRKIVLPLAQTAALELREDEGGLLMCTVGGLRLRLAAIHRVGALHALVAELVDARANYGQRAHAPGRVAHGIAAHEPASPVPSTTAQPRAPRPWPQAS